MKLISYKHPEKGEQLGIYHQNLVYNMNQVSDGKIADRMLPFLEQGEAAMQAAKKINEEIIKNPKQYIGETIGAEQWLAPVPKPTSCRDGYAFRQHVASARKNRGVEMIAEFDEYPIFYFTNHNAIQGPGDIVCMPDHFDKLDFELEAAIVIGKKGINVKAHEADSYIAGYMIMNDMSARTLQMEEMKLNLGPAKGKDFSTVIGPYLVTPDELENYKTQAKSKPYRQ